MSGPDETRKYWDQNIDKWADLYLEISHSRESLLAPGWLSFLYKKFLVPHEAKLMAERFRLTMSFIERYVHEGSVAVDVGCGSGIFTVEMLRHGAHVKAVDFAQTSLSLTRSLVERLLPDRSKNVDYLLMDVSRQRLPSSDVVLAMGVTPYLVEVAPFYDNILPTTKAFYCLVLDPDHWANRVRQRLPFLNVRGMHWFAKSEIDDILRRHGWHLVDRRPFASGYLDLAHNQQP